MMAGAEGQDAHARIAALQAELENERAQRVAAQARVAELETERDQERAQFALAERATRVGYWRYPLENSRRTWSPGMYAMLGLDPGASISEVEALISQASADEIRRYLEKRSAAVSDRSPFTLRQHIRCIDGTERIIDVFGEPEIDVNGKVVAFVGACHDVTQQVLLECERDKLQELYRIMMEAASDIITVYGLRAGKRKHEFASAALGRVLGWTLSDLEGDGFLERLHPDDLEEAKKLQATPPPGQSLTATYRVRHADGRYVWIEGTINSVYDEATREVLYQVGVARDVSERKAHEQAIEAARSSAEAANRAKSAFLANMSHELRTPLNAIIGFTDVMNREMFGPVENVRYRNYIDSIHKSGTHLLGLINDILDIAKIEAGKLELHLEDVNLAETVGECVHAMSESAASASVELKALLPDKGLTIPADLHSMKQVVLNLLSNAIKFTPAGGRVLIEAAGGGDVVRLVVRDDGIGIAAEDLPRLAKPFEQVCDDPALAKMGTGLGLAVVRAIAEQHGGRLTIESPARQGTIATVEFPTRAARREAAA